MNEITIFLILCLIAESIGFILFYHKSIKPRKQEEQKQHQDELDKIYQIQKEINELSSQKTQLLQDIEKKKQEVEQTYEKEKNKFSEQINLYKTNLSLASEQYVDNLEQQYIKTEKEYQKKVEQLEQQEQSYTEQIEKYNNEIESLKASLYAGAQAHLREKEVQEQLNFYMLQISDDDLEDIEKLNELKKSIHHPKAISKVIWTVYFQKEASALCGRVLGSFTVCGIYKITNIKTHECYIGQSKDIASRWKDHIKCGLGIDTPSTNKLYKAIDSQGIWNFTFELLEECSYEQLNEKEAFWIDMYQACDLGYNSTKGNKK